jgi:hypothetical protein
MGEKWTPRSYASGTGQGPGCGGAGKKARADRLTAKNPLRCGQHFAQARHLVRGLGQDACQQGIFLLESLHATMTTTFCLSHMKIIDVCARFWRSSLTTSRFNTLVRTHHPPPGPKSRSPARRHCLTRPTVPQSVMLERFLIVAVTDFKQKVGTARESGIESWKIRAVPRQFAPLPRAYGRIYNLRDRGRPTTAG